MADLNKKYQTILNELTQRIQNKDELEFVKGKMNELVIEYISSIERIFEIEKNQEKLENKIRKIQRELSMIEEDIYVNDELESNDNFIGDKMHDNDYEFEITCPYCGYEFLTDDSYKCETEIKCPQCHEIIELDWKDEKCGGDCHACESQCYSENGETGEVEEETVKVEEPQIDNKNNTTNNNQDINYNNNNVNQILQNNENKKENNEDDM